MTLPGTPVPDTLIQYNPRSNAGVYVYVMFMLTWYCWSAESVLKRWTRRPMRLCSSVNSSISSDLAQKTNEIMTIRGFRIRSRLRFGLRIRLRILLLSSVIFKMATKNCFFFLRFFTYYFLSLHLNHFSKIKSHKEVTKQ